MNSAHRRPLLVLDRADGGAETVRVQTGEAGCSKVRIYLVFCFLPWIKVNAVLSLLQPNLNQEVPL